MKSLNTAMRAPGILVVLACLTVSFSVIEGFTQEHPQQPIRHSQLVRDLAASGQPKKHSKRIIGFINRVECSLKSYSLKLRGGPSTVVILMYKT